MASVLNKILIAGPATAVFDLVTTARFWPHWHPASRAVGGVIERPYELGNHVNERGEVAGIVFQITWKVVEHIRPVRAVLLAQESATRISYTFEGGDGVVEFRRQLEYDEVLFGAALPDPGTLSGLLHVQSQEALERLKKLVEEILHKETLGLRDLVWPQ